MNHSLIHWQGYILGDAIASKKNPLWFLNRLFSLLFRTAFLEGAKGCRRRRWGGWCKSWLVHKAGDQRGKRSRGKIREASSANKISKVGIQKGFLEIQKKINRHKVGDQRGRQATQGLCQQKEKLSLLTPRRHWGQRRWGQATLRTNIIISWMFASIYWCVIINPWLVSSEARRALRAEGHTWTEKKIMV